MTAVDTNIIIRFLVRDDERQAQKVYARFKQAEAARERLFVPLLVVLEAIWVLESVYRMGREEILGSLEDLIRMPILHFQTEQVIHDLLRAGGRHSADLDDLLIACAAKAAGSGDVLTLDRKASKFPPFRLLE